MAVTVTMLQTRRGEDGSLWNAGSSYSATDAFAAFLITSNLATGALPQVPVTGLSPAQQTAVASLVSGAGVVAASRTADPLDNGDILELAPSVTYTLTDAAPLPLGVTLIGPSTGVAALAADGAATVNGSASSVEIAAMQVYRLLMRASAAHAYVIAQTGTGSPSPAPAPAPTPAPAPSPVTVGGVVTGTAGTAGTMYEGYTLSWGDEFEILDVLAPHRPRGRWMTTRIYGTGARGSDTILGTMYDTDPYFTGHNDSNRGVPVGYNNMSLGSSELRLQARKATAGEQVHMQSTRNELASMIAGPTAVHWYPAAAGTGDIIVEARIKFSAAAGNPAGWHPTMWLLTLTPTPGSILDEIDWEGNGQAAYLNRNVHTSGSVASSTAGSPYAHDGQFHVIAMVVNTTSVQLYIDGTLYATGAWNGNSKGLPQYPIFSSHVYNANFNGETYSASAWNADADGATMTVDWTRVWRRTGKAHFYPLLTVADQFVAYGASRTFTLPAALDLWGDAAVSEYLQVLYAEDNDPGVTHTSVFTQFPPGVTYNSTTRQVTVNLSSGNTGRLNFILSAWKTDGATGEPLRFAVNVGPKINLASLDYDEGDAVSYDLYAACECGVLTSNGTTRAKTITVDGLAGSGLTYSDTTGLLTGTASLGSYTLTVTCTNSVGQVATASIPLTISAVGASYAYYSWTGPGWFDASNAASVSAPSGVVASVANRRSGGDALVPGGASVTYVSGAQNGLAGIRMTRDTANPSRLVASAFTTSALSTMFQGDDKPFTVLVVYKPTDTNTGFIWSASASDPTNAQVIALVRRNATASSSRREQAVGVGGDTNFGSGQASGSARVVAFKYTGTAISIWDNSTTATVSGTSADVPAFGTGLTFRIGCAATTAPSGTAFGTVACAMDFFEIVIESTAKSDADIQQAISDMGTKWGITIA